MSIPKVIRYEKGKALMGQVDAPFKVDWSTWQTMTNAQKKGRKWLIENVPGADGFITVDNMKLLWENPSPAAAFAQQNITLNSSDYDFLLIQYSYYIGQAIQSVTISKGQSAHLTMVYLSSNNKQNAYRDIAYVNDTTLTINDCLFNETTYTTNNSYCVPIAIYGFKKQQTIRFDALAKNVKATVDYSTDERIIGTYNGQNLYAKSWFPSVTVAQNTYTEVATLPSNAIAIYTRANLKLADSNKSLFTVPNKNSEIYVNVSNSIQILQNESATTICDFVYAEYIKTT